MEINKKISIGIIVLVLVVAIWGIVRGVNSYKEENPNGNTVPLAEETSTKCIITIKDSKYDVTEFKNKHTGGDVFKCGEDMTVSFEKRHKGYLPMIEKFKVN